MLIECSCDGATRARAPTASLAERNTSSKPDNRTRILVKTRREILLACAKTGVLVGCSLEENIVEEDVEVEAG